MGSLFFKDAVVLNEKSEVNIDDYPEGSVIFVGEENYNNAYIKTKDGFRALATPDYFTFYGMLNENIPIMGIELPALGIGGLPGVPYEGSYMFWNFFVHGSAGISGDLDVTGRILTSGLTIIQPSDEYPWPDYVFSDEYELMNLDELDKFVKENRHLPGIPTENEINENGVDIGLMQTRTIEKIEELTLHVIELNKQNQELRSEIEELKNSRRE